MTTSLQPAYALVPGANLEAYVHTVNSIPLLTPEQERELAESLYYEQDLGAARQMVLAHLRFVVHIARSYSGYGLAQADLIQEGNVGLMKAVKRFNPEMGVRLVSFAVHWIKAEIHEFILRNWRIVKVATTKAQRKLFFNLRSQKKRLAWLNNEEVHRVAESLGVEPREVREMESRLTGHDMAFDPAAEADDDSAFQSPANYLEDHRYDPARQLEDADWSDNSNHNLHEALEVLDDVQKLYKQLQTQAGGLVQLDTKMTLAMSPVSEVALTKTTQYRSEERRVGKEARCEV